MNEKTIRPILIAIGLFFLFIMLIVPLCVVFSTALQRGWNVYLSTFTDTYALDAIYLTLLVTFVALVVNTLFGLISAWTLTKYNYRGKSMLNAIIDIPFAVSPVIVGLFFITLIGRRSPFYEWLWAHHIQLIFAVPAIIMVTVFVTAPYITRSLAPLMESQGREQEEAARMLGASGLTIFYRITLPNIKWGLVYGVVLCTARALGEFGAVAVVSGHIRGKTLTMPLYVETLYNEYNFVGAFAISSALVMMAVFILVLRNMAEIKSIKGD